MGPEAAASEWQAEFRTDIAAFLSDEDIDACVDFDRPAELPPRDTIGYHAFADPSGGRHDVFTLCIAHRDDEHTIIDVLRGRHPPFDVTSAVNEYAMLLREYGVNSVVGDNYAAEWVEQAFRSTGIKYVRSELPKGRLYVEGLPAFTRRTVSLPNHPRLLRELRLLERRPHVGGRDTVDHGRTGGDDYANALFGVLRHAAKRKPRMRIVIASGDGTGPIIEIDLKTGEPIEKSEWFPGYALKAGPQPARHSRSRHPHRADQVDGCRTCNACCAPWISGATKVHGKENQCPFTASLKTKSRRLHRTERVRWWLKSDATIAWGKIARGRRRHARSRPRRRK